MTDLMMQLPDAVTDARGAFFARAMARACEDGSWEGWLEFVPANAHASIGYTTPIETRQRDRVTMERWASGLTRVDAEGALSRARLQRDATAVPELVTALKEIVEALDRRIPQVDRAGEARIAADAELLRADAIQRIAVLRNAISGWEDDGGVAQRQFSFAERGDTDEPGFI
jgi:hypothetical protein